jgi:hypothetical protein
MEKTQSAAAASRRAARSIMEHFVRCSSFFRQHSAFPPAGLPGIFCAVAGERASARCFGASFVSMRERRRRVSPAPCDKEIMLKVTLPDGSVRQYSRPTRPIEIAAEIGPGLAKATLAASVNGKVVGANVPLPADGEVSLRLLTKKDPEALAVMRHSCAHVMAPVGLRTHDRQRLLLRRRPGAQAHRG